MNLKALIARLSPPARETLEAAVAAAMSRTHYDAELEHWLLKLVERGDPGVDAILAHFEVDAGRLAGELSRAIDAFKTGNGRSPALSPRIVRAARAGWLFASLDQEAGSVSPGHLLAATLADRELGGALRECAGQLKRIDAAALERDYRAIVGSVAAEGRADDDGAGSDGGTTAAPVATSGGKALDSYCIDLTAQARAGRIDPVLGRDAEIRQVIDILTRRRQNNPILTGEAGVGKTAVVEGFARRIAEGDVPPALRTVRLLSLDLGLLQAGAGVRGEFENRLKSVIEEVKASAQPIVLFIDEAHTLVGAGGQEGQGDAANLLKPALARGELRTVAATTWAEYKKYFEKDAALTRRFQVVQVGEPDEDAAIEMMRGLVATLEKHHGVRILDEAVQASVRLSHRYIFGRQLPDKSISVLDTAAARVAISNSAVPAAIEDAGRRIVALETERDILLREEAGGGGHAERLAAIDAALDEVRGTERDLRARWEKEGELIAAIRADRDAIATDDTAAARMAEARDALGELQGERPLMFDMVDRHAVADIVGQWTGIPVGRMLADELRGIRDLEALMGERIKGQDQALRVIGDAMRTARAGLTDARKPTGVFLMVGVSGVGKTETALALADRFYGGAQNLSVINMSEFKEEHKVSMLLGAPPGYVGYGEGGVLTEAVRRKPFSVVLLDEMEKAHPGVQDVFYQLFDKGRIKDGQGRDIDFRNTMLIMTSNAGSDLIERLCADPDAVPDAAGMADALRPELLKHFKPAFLGRVTVIPYFPLTESVLRDVVALALGRLGDRLRESYGAELRWSEATVDAIKARCTETQSGARNVEAVIAGSIAPELAGILLQRRQDGIEPRLVALDVDTQGKLTYAVDP